MPILELINLSKNSYQIDANCFRKSSETKGNIPAPLIFYRLPVDLPHDLTQLEIPENIPINCSLSLNLSRRILLKGNLPKFSNVKSTSTIIIDGNIDEKALLEIKGSIFINGDVALGVFISAKTITINGDVAQAKLKAREIIIQGTLKAKTHTLSSQKLMKEYIASITAEKIDISKCEGILNQDYKIIQVKSVPSEVVKEKSELDGLVVTKDALFDVPKEKDELDILNATKDSLFEAGKEAGELDYLDIAHYTLSDDVKKEDPLDDRDVGNILAFKVIKEEGEVDSFVVVKEVPSDVVKEEGELDIIDAANVTIFEQPQYSIPASTLYHDDRKQHFDHIHLKRRKEENWEQKSKIQNLKSARIEANDDLRSPSITAFKRKATEDSKIQSGEKRATGNIPQLNRANKLINDVYAYYVQNPQGSAEDCFNKFYFHLAQKSFGNFISYLLLCLDKYGKATEIETILPHIKEMLHYYTQQVLDLNFEGNEAYDISNIIFRLTNLAKKKYQLPKVCEDIKKLTVVFTKHLDPSIIHICFILSSLGIFIYSQPLAEFNFNDIEDSVITLTHKLSLLDVIKKDIHNTFFGLFLLTKLGMNLRGIEPAIVSLLRKLITFRLFPQDIIDSLKNMEYFIQTGFKFVKIDAEITFLITALSEQNSLTAHTISKLLMKIVYLVRNGIKPDKEQTENAITKLVQLFVKTNPEIEEILYFTFVLSNVIECQFNLTNINQFLINFFQHLLISKPDADSVALFIYRIGKLAEKDIVLDGIENDLLSLLDRFDEFETHSANYVRIFCGITQLVIKGMNLKNIEDRVIRLLEKLMRLPAKLPDVPIAISCLAKLSDHGFIFKRFYPEITSWVGKIISDINDGQTIATLIWALGKLSLFGYQLADLKLAIPILLDKCIKLNIQEFYVNMIIIGITKLAEKGEHINNIEPYLVVLAQRFSQFNCKPQNSAGIINNFSILAQCGYKLNTVKNIIIDISQEILKKVMTVENINFTLSGLGRFSLIGLFDKDETITVANIATQLILKLNFKLQYEISNRQRLFNVVYTLYALSMILTPENHKYITENIKISQIITKLLLYATNRKLNCTQSTMLIYATGRFVQYGLPWDELKCFMERFLLVCNFEMGITDKYTDIKEGIKTLSEYQLYELLDSEQVSANLLAIVRNAKDQQLLERLDKLISYKVVVLIPIINDEINPQNTDSFILTRISAPIITPSQAQPVKYRIRNQMELNALVSKEQPLIYEKNREIEEDVYIAPVALLSGRLGVYAASTLRARSCLGRYIGKRLSKEDETDSAYVFDAEDEFIDAELFGNYTRYINHSSEPNVKVVCKKHNGKKEIFFYVLDEDIEQDAQLFINYLDDYFEIMGFKPFYLHSSDNWKDLNTIYHENRTEYAEELIQLGSRLTKAFGLAVNSYLLAPKIIIKMLDNNNPDINETDLRNGANLPCISMDNNNFLSLQQQQLITPLMVAAFLGQIKVVTNLIANGADVNRRCLNSGNSALFFAVFGLGDEETKLAIIKELINNQAYITCVNSDKHNILSYCIHFNYINLAAYFLKNLSQEIVYDLLAYIVEKEPLYNLEYCYKKEERIPLLNLLLEAMPDKYFAEQVKEENISPEIARLKRSENDVTAKKLIAIRNIFSRPNTETQSLSFALSIDDNLFLDKPGQYRTKS